MSQVSGQNIFIKIINSKVIEETYMIGLSKYFRPDT